MDLEIETIENLTPEEIENIRVEKLKELEIRQANCSLVESEYLSTQLQMIELQKKKKELEIMLSKAKQTVRQLNTQIKILTSKYWSARR